LKRDAALGSGSKQKILGESKISKNQSVLLPSWQPISKIVGFGLETSWHINSLVIEESVTGGSLLR